MCNLGDCGKGDDLWLAAGWLGDSRSWVTLRTSGGYVSSGYMRRVVQSGNERAFEEIVAESPDDEDTTDRVDQADGCYFTDHCLLEN